MLRLLLPLVIFLLFIIEGTIFQVFSLNSFGFDWFIIPRFAFLVVIVVTIFLGRTTGVIYALILGLFQDVIYTHVLGVYIFSMGLVAYLLGFTYKIFQKNLSLLVITAVFGTLFLDYLVYGIHFMVGITDLTHTQFFNERVFPSIVVNGLFMLIIVYPLRKFILFLQKSDDVEEKINKRKKDFSWQR